MPLPFRLAHQTTSHTKLVTGEFSNELRTAAQEALSEAAAEWRSFNEELVPIQQALNDTSRAFTGLSEDMRRRAEQSQEFATDSIEELRQEKGVNPSCWYEKVATLDGGLREKPFYTSNLVVFDDGIAVHQVEAPPSGADDDGGGTYAQESEQLGLRQLQYDSPLSDAEFLNRFRDIQRAGKEKQVHSYSCIFWVRVWDRTSATAKERWKKEAHLNIV